MASLANTAEGGTNGVTVTTANSGGASGDAFTTVTFGAGALVFDTAQHAKGSLSYRIDQPSTTTAIYTEWATSVLPDAWGRCYVRLGATNAQDIYIIEYLNGTIGMGGASIAATTRFLQVRRGGITVLSTGTVAIPLNQWVRIECHLLGGTTASPTGTLEARLFLNPDSTTADDIITATGVDTGNSATMNRVRMGCSISSGISGGSMWIDDLKYDSLGWIGPSPPDPVFVKAGMFDPQLNPNVWF